MHGNYLVRKFPYVHPMGEMDRKFPYIPLRLLRNTMTILVFVMLSRLFLDINPHGKTTEKAARGS